MGSVTAKLDTIGRGRMIGYQDTAPQIRNEGSVFTGEYFENTRAGEGFENHQGFT